MQSPIRSMQWSVARTFIENSANIRQEEKNRPKGGGHPDDQFNDRYSHTQRQQQPQQPQQLLYSQQNTQSSQPQTVGADGADPYAAYGGYQNYVAMWYRTIAQQQQQGVPQDQGPPGEQRPPGS